MLRWATPELGSVAQLPLVVVDHWLALLFVVVVDRCWVGHLSARIAAQHPLSIGDCGPSLGIASELMD